MQNYKQTSIITCSIALSLAAFSSAEPTITLNPLTSIRTGIFDDSAAEIVSYDGYC